MKHATDVDRRTLTLRLLGTMQVFLGEKPLPPLRSRKGEWLLAALALRGGAVSRSWLAGTLWPESEESRALLYLRRELTYLRKALGPECERLRATGRTLQLDLDGADCDLLAFDAALSRGDASSLEAAVALYRGPLLEGCDQEWVILDRQSREQAYLDALERLAQSASARGEDASAVRWLRSVVARDRLRESAQRALMAALASSGDPAAAIQVYRDLRLYLRRELNVDVDPETTALFHRLRDAARRPALPSAGTASAGYGLRITRIPAPLTPLIGRSQALREVRRRLEGSRLLTLTGTGGVGKTRLAIEVAEEMQDDFSGGVCFIELAAIRDAAVVAQAVLDAFGVKPEPRRTALETLMDRIGSSDLLLVLDNCEHLIQACAQLSGALLGACPHLRILTASREPLGIAGESLWRVPSLSIPPATAHVGTRETERVAEALEYEAVLLFVERAQRARADFVLTDDTVGPVSQVCRRLDGIPLAIELAAVRVRSLTVEDIHRRLDHRFGLLTGGSRMALPRHQTLRSLIDWSYDLLNEAEKALLRRLSVFAGGWSLEAAEQVCAGDPVEGAAVLDVLTSLSDKSLVVAETVGASVRYRLLETVRQYAQDCLAERGDLDVWQDRHLSCFLTLVEQAEPQLLGSDQKAWFKRLETEYDNIRAALEHSLEPRSGPEGGLRLCSALWWFWQVRGHYSEGRQWCERVLGREATPSRSRERAGVLHGSAAMARLQGDYTASRARFEESLALRQEIEDRRGIAYGLHGLGCVTSDQGDYDVARRFLEESLVIHQETGNRWGIALVLNRLGYVAHEQNDYAASRDLYERSLSLRWEIGDSWGIANSLNNLGALAYDQSDYARARTLYGESLTIQREIEDRTGIAVSLSNLGNVACREGDFSGARAALAEGISVAHQIGDRKRVCEALEAWAGLAIGESEWGRAALLLGAVEALREAIGSPLPPNERPRYDRDVNAARAALADDAAFDAAWARGRTLTLEQAVAHALTRVW